MVDSVNADGSIPMSYMICSDSKGIAWVYQEDSEVFQTAEQQIIETFSYKLCVFCMNKVQNMQGSKILHFH